jgi:hypothetical protein
MASLIGTAVANNYQKVTSNPNSKLGTRELSFLKITGIEGVGTSTTAANSILAQTLRGVSTRAEVYYYNAQSADVLIVAVAADTLSASETATDETATYGLFEAAIDAATGGGSLACTVAAATFA